MLIICVSLVDLLYVSFVLQFVINAESMLHIKYYVIISMMCDITQRDDLQCTLCHAFLCTEESSRREGNSITKETI